VQEASYDLALIGWALAAWVVGAAARRTLGAATRAQFLPQALQQHAWLAGIVALGVLWSLQIRIVNGVHLSMVGVPLYALLVGRDRAIIGAFIALVGLTALTDRVWADVGVTTLVSIALPAWTVSLAQTQISRRLPHNVFIFMIGNGMFATLVSAAAANVASLLLQIMTAAASVQIADDLIGYGLMLAWGEALATGMAFSALVIYRPGAVMTYSQDEYLPRR
jgi:uncharacterized membrane protein